jgi:hypothetical protein
MAANSAPDACREVGKSFMEGVTERDIKLCRSIARLVRDQAMKFSDQEIEGKLSIGPKEGEKMETPLEGACGASCARSCG